jgi:death-on-curing protein
MIQYLTVLDVIAMNGAIMERMGGESILRDEAALESAVMRPQMAAHYAEADLAEQAATLMAGVALAHAFVDGNKRTALAAGTTFLILNGHWIVSRPTELGEQIIAIVERTGTLDEAVAQVAVWLRERSEQI